MKYMGSKARISKDILPIIQNYIDKYNIDNYLEPFVGGANIIDKVSCKNKYGNDINEYLIAVYNNMDKVKNLPKEVSREEYSKVRNCYNLNLDTYEKWYIGCIGFFASYNGRFFDGGYSGIVRTKLGKTRNYYDESKRNFESQIPDLLGIKWSNVNYKYINNLQDFMIYCDIPYENTKQYNTSKNFDYDVFWNWAREKSKNNIVLISEYKAPDDFECIWEKQLLKTINNNKKIDSVERLFKIKI